MSIQNQWFIPLAWTCALLCAGSIGCSDPHGDAGPADSGADSAHDADQDRDDGGAEACPGGCPEGEVCDDTTGTCRSATCWDIPCESGMHCDPVTDLCVPDLTGEEPKYEVVELIGFLGRGDQDGPALQSTGGGRGQEPDPSGSALYYYSGSQIKRYDAGSGLVEVLAGVGVTGYADGPFDAAMFDVNDYQGGGLGLGLDGDLYLLDQQNFGGIIRVIDLEAREVRTLAGDALGGALDGPTIQCLSIGLESGDIYVGGWGGMFRVTTDGDVTELPCDETGELKFMAVDEARGLIFAIDRSNPGAFWEWDIDGGPRRILNSESFEATNNDQYTSDGPVAQMRLFCPSEVILGHGSSLYIGAGDGETFRRYNPDTGQVRSLCENEDGTMEWCIGDGSNNRPFHGWMNKISFDAVGNGYLNVSTVWPQTFMLRRVE